jgi:hypothetical protein
LQAVVAPGRGIWTADTDAPREIPILRGELVETIGGGIESYAHAIHAEFLRGLAVPITEKYPQVFSHRHMP